MIETTNPEIDVNELMERVRREVATVVPRVPRAVAPVSRARPPMLPPVLEVPAVPAIGLSQPMELKRDRLEQGLQKARAKLSVSRSIPKFLRGLFRRQGGFNFSILELLTNLLKNQLQLSKRVGELMIIAEQQHRWLENYSSHGQTQAAWMRSAAPILANVSVTQENLERLDLKLKEFAETHASIEHLTNLQAQVDRASEQASELREDTVQLRSDYEQLQATCEHQAELLKGVRGDLDHAGEHLRSLQAAFDHAGEHLRNLQGESDRRALLMQSLQDRTETQALEQAKTATGLDHFAQLRNAFVRLEERQTNESIYVKGELAQHSALLHGRQPSVTTGKQPAKSGVQDSSAADAHRLDWFYLSFENRFRGRRSEIKERVRFYLPSIKEADAGTADRPILDVGCGRGEWLELLRENGLEAAGVDLNSAMVAQCVQRDLVVTEADAIQHLRSLPDTSLGAVSGFHIIEHLSLEILIDLVAETQRVLQPGGLVIFESPNCKNLTVGACNFNIDPTHRNPIFPETAQFILEAHGFENVRLEYLSPAEQSPFSKDDQNSAALTTLLYGPQDFAVIGRKPAAK